MINPDLLFYAVSTDEADYIADTFIGAHVMGVTLGSDDHTERATAMSLKMSDGRTLHFGIVDGQLIFCEEGLGEA
jgi:hypothetical protein